jgi:hypothetical protein
MSSRTSVVLRLSVAVAVAVTAVLVVLALAPPQAGAHRSRCHQRHTCPSDHATYRWRGLRCVAPYSEQWNRSFRRRVRHQGRTYLLQALARIIH